MITYEIFSRAWLIAHRNQPLAVAVVSMNNGAIATNPCRSKCHNAVKQSWTYHLQFSI